MHLELFPLRKGRFINTWKNGFAMKANQCSGDLYRIKPWIETFWSNYSGTQYCLTGPEYYSTCGRCSTKDQKAPQHLRNRFCHEGKSMFWPFILNQTMNTDLLSDPTTVVHNADGLDLNTFPPVEDALPSTRREDSSTPRKMVSPWRQFNFLAFFTGSHHEYTLSERTAVAYWLHQNTSPHTEYAVPWTTRLFKTWKTNIAMNIY